MYAYPLVSLDRKHKDTLEKSIRMRYDLQVSDLLREHCFERENTRSGE